MPARGSVFGVCCVKAWQNKDRGGRTGRGLFGMRLISCRPAHLPAAEARLPGAPAAAGGHAALGGALAGCCCGTGRAAAGRSGHRGPAAAGVTGSRGRRRGCCRRHSRLGGGRRSGRRVTGAAPPAAAPHAPHARPVRAGLAAAHEPGTAQRAAADEHPGACLHLRFPRRRHCGRRGSPAAGCSRGPWQFAPASTP